jgi:hypothetical protein
VSYGATYTVLRFRKQHADVCVPVHTACVNFNRVTASSSVVGSVLSYDEM